MHAATTTQHVPLLALSEALPNQLMLSCCSMAVLLSELLSIFLVGSFNECWMPVYLGLLSTYTFLTRRNLSELLAHPGVHFYG
jgi:hypothetical protein